MKMMDVWTHRLIWALAILFLVPACSEDLETYERPVPHGEGPWVLFDHYHARKQNHVDFQLDKGVYRYQGAFGYSRFVEHLERNDYKWAEIREMPLSAERLDGFDALFINLVSNERPDFSEEEVDAIIEFVGAGGGLFVIADHTNVYDHAERVNKFLEPMGVEVLYYTAVDYPPEHSVAGLGWILVDDIVEHPVTNGVEKISLQTGGPMASDDGQGDLAFTSEDSFGDLWNKESGLGYYGDWRFDEEDDLEGPLNVHAAVEYGEGRIIVAGDQNMFGDPWLNYVDNFQIAMNSMEWIVQRDGTGAPLRSADIPGLEIALDQVHNQYGAGNLGAQNGYFAYLVNSNRDRETTTKGALRITDEEVLKYMNPSVEFEESELDTIKSHMEDGATVVIGFEPNSVRQPAFQLLAALDPDFSFSYGGETYGVDDWETLDAAEIVTTPGAEPLSSPQMNLSDLTTSAWTKAPNTRPPENADPVEPNNPTTPEAEPYWFDVSSEWGEEFISAGDYTVARRKSMGGGELIVFVQDGIFRTKTLGDYLTPPNALNQPAHELNFRFLEYLKARHGVGQTDE